MPLFTGKSFHTIDDKQRLAIPAKHRASDSIAPENKGKKHAKKPPELWYCVPWPGGILRLYPADQFESLARTRSQSLTPAEDEAELEVELFADAEKLVVDGQGRITIPRDHLDLAGLTPESEVVVLGVLGRLEVRDRARWLEKRTERFARLPELVAAIEAKRAGHAGKDAR